nr:uncharacterized protein LOC119186067 [Rhipicephalus microplus]
MVPPDVTNLHLVRISANDFTIAWTKPKFSFNYYWIDVTGVTNVGTRATPGTTGSCVNGTIIHADWTQVTCSQLQPCSKVSFQVRTHISGPPSRTSHGVSLQDILIPALVPPEVTNLTLGAVDEDTFVLNWQRPDACFDYYTVEVIDESTYNRSAVTCNNGTLIDPSWTSVICDQIKTCANVTIRVKTHTWGPPERASIGTVLKHVFLLGKAPPEPTNMKLVSAEGGNFTVKFKVQRECFDGWYLYKGVVSKSNSSVLTADNCVLNRSAYNQRTLICTAIQACGKLDLKVWTVRNGPPERRSSPAILPSIHIRGNCLR